MTARLCIGFALALLLSTGAQARGHGTIVITASVDGATVEIDGKVVGQTPLKPHAVSSGNHKVKIKKLGFMEHAETVRVGNAKTAQVVADLLPAAGVLKITCNVNGAQVQVDGKNIGKAPLEAEIKMGKRTITVSSPGHARFKTVVQAAPGNIYPFEVSLTRHGTAGGDDLELEPLALAPLASGTKARGKKHHDDELSLDLEPLTDAPETQAPAVVAVLPVGALSTSATAVEPAKPWYKEYWVWGVAAAVVAGGVVLAVAASGDETPTTRIADSGWQPGLRKFDPPLALTFGE